MKCAADPSEDRGKRTGAPGPRRAAAAFRPGTRAECGNGITILEPALLSRRGCCHPDRSRRLPPGDDRWTHLSRHRRRHRRQGMKAAVRARIAIVRRSRAAASGTVLLHNVRIDGRILDLARLSGGILRKAVVSLGIILTATACPSALVARHRATVDPATAGAIVPVLGPRPFIEYFRPFTEREAGSDTIGGAAAVGPRSSRNGLEDVTMAQWN